MDERMHENEIHANTKRQNEGTWNWKWLLKFHSHARNWNNLFYSKKSQSQNYSKMDHLRHHSQKWVIIRDPQTEFRTQKPSWIEHFEAGNITWKHTQPGYLQTQWLSWIHKLTLQKLHFEHGNMNLNLTTSLWAWKLQFGLGNIIVSFDRTFCDLNDFISKLIMMFPSFQFHF